MSRLLPVAGVVPFASSNEGTEWCKRNCVRCQRNGFRHGGDVCSLERAIAESFVTGSMSERDAREAGAVLDGETATMPVQCRDFLPPPICEHMVGHLCGGSHSKRRFHRCGKPAGLSLDIDGVRTALCRFHSLKANRLSTTPAKRSNTRARR